MRSKYLCLDIFIFRDVHDLSGGFCYTASRAILFDKKTQKIYTADVCAARSRIDNCVTLSFNNNITIKIINSKKSHNHLIYSILDKGRPWELISR